MGRIVKLGISLLVGYLCYPVLFTNSYQLQSSALPGICFGAVTFVISLLATTNLLANKNVVSVTMLRAAYLVGIACFAGGLISEMVFPRRTCIIRDPVTEFLELALCLGIFRAVYRFADRSKPSPEQV